MTTTLENTSLKIPVLNVDIPISTFNPASLLITTQPTSGQVVVNSDGTVTYTPSANFVGGDEFRYTVADNNGQTSNIGIVDINVGVEISSAKGANKSVNYTDENGTPVTITLNKGVADVFFDGIGTAPIPVKGKVTVTGQSLRARQITLSGTSVASSLKIAGLKNGQMNLGGISDASPLGSIVAPGANLRATGSTSLLGLSTTTHPLISTQATAVVATTIASAGTLQLAGVKSISLRTANSANIILGGTGVTGTSLTFAGTVTDTDLTSTVAITSIKAKAWVKSATDIQLVTAPSINSITTVGDFDPDLTLSSVGRVPALGTAKIGGAVSIGSWSVTGNAKSISIGSATSSWGGLTVSGNLASFSAKGALPADITAGSINSLKVAGVLGGTITTTGNLLSLQAGQLVNAFVNVGSTATSIANATLADLGHSTLKSLKVTSKAGNSFSDSSIVADIIGSIYTGPVNAASGATPEGIAAKSIKSATVIVDGGTVALPASALVSDATLASYLTAKGKTLGSFTIDIVTA